MQIQPWLALAVVREAQQREIERAAQARLLASSRPSFRRSVGHRVIAVGRRIAAEPSLELARSR
ncbi:MAG: hypothetical protein H0U37_10875 [Chloroflexi bacterium]|nr:hypothetical protein [Chloroflexota bacterium]